MYRRESASDLFDAAEQLEAIRGLILQGTPIKARMALILLDGLADAILFRRIAEIYRASEEPLFRHQMPRYPSKGRQRARQRFNRRVDLVSEVTEVDRWLGDGQPLVDAHDAAVLKVGHSYRNDAYHEDAHNPTVISSVVRLLFAAVARLVVRAQRRGWGEWGMSDGTQEQLAKWGMTDTSMLRYDEAAEAMAEHLTAGLEVDPAELREELAEDIEARVESLRDDVEWLRSNTTLDPATIILGVELQAKYGADEELLACREELDSAASLRSTEDPNTQAERIHTAARRVWERMDELEKAHTPQVTLALLDKGDGVAARVRRAPDATNVLVTYHDFDQQLSELEEYVYEAVSTVDREIQLQIDIARGK